jgi:hypothetical protein
MATTQDIDEFFRRCKIDNDCKVEGQKITVSLLIELLDKFSTEQIKKLNLHSVSKSDDSAKDTVCPTCNKKMEAYYMCIPCLKEFIK